MKKEMEHQKPDPQEPIHPVQKFMDNIWLLLLLGITVPFVSYTLWGLLELLNIKPGSYP